MHDVRCVLYDVRCATYDALCKCYVVSCALYDVCCMFIEVRCTLYDVCVYGVLIVNVVCCAALHVVRCSLRDVRRTVRTAPRMMYDSC